MSFRLAIRQVGAAEISPQSSAVKSQSTPSKHEKGPGIRGASPHPDAIFPLPSPRDMQYNPRQRGSDGDTKHP
jgi:hypothetical protein